MLCKTLAILLSGLNYKKDKSYLYGIIGVSRVVNRQTQLIDALIESYGRDNKNGGPDVDRRFFHFAKLGVILGLVRRDQFATKQ